MFEEHEKLDHTPSGIKYLTSCQSMDFTSPNLNGRVIYDEQSGIFTIYGRVSVIQPIRYLAANPLWRNGSYSGSALPYPDPIMAYDRSPNRGITMPDSGGLFVIKLVHPSEYYTGQGKTLMKPHVHLHLQTQNIIVTVVLGEIFPYRSLKNLPKQPNRSIGR